MLSFRRAMSSAAKRRPIVGGNWKCNPASASKLPELIANINACDTDGAGAAAEVVSLPTTTDTCADQSQRHRRDHWLIFAQTVTALTADATS